MLRLEKVFSCFRLISSKQTLVLPIHYDSDPDSNGEPISVGDFTLKQFDAGEKLAVVFAARSPVVTEPSTLEQRDGNGG